MVAVSFFLFIHHICIGLLHVQLVWARGTHIRTSPLNRCVLSTNPPRTGVNWVNERDTEGANNFVSRPISLCGDSSILRRRHFQYFAHMLLKCWFVLFFTLLKVSTISTKLGDRSGLVKFLCSSSTTLMFFSSCKSMRVICSAISEEEKNNNKRKND